MMTRLNQLKAKLQQELYIIEQQPEKALFKWKESVNISMAVVIQLKEEMKDYKFENENQEISFHKEVVPWFYSQVIYYHHLFHIEGKMATSGHNENRKFLKRKRCKIQRFLKKHHYLHLYIKMGETSCDEKYFLRKNQDPLYSDIVFTINNGLLKYVYKLSKIIALEKVKMHLEAKIAELEQHTMQEKGRSKTKPSLRWTASKSDLIELLYALHSSHLFNDSTTTDVRQIANWLESTLHIDLGNYYRVFQSIRQRKKNRTQFMDNLRENLIRRMDETDDQPRN